MEKVIRVFKDLESGKKVKYEVQEDGTLKELKVKLSKYTPKQEITLTELEKQLVLSFNNSYSWIARNEDNEILICIRKPIKNNSRWVCTGVYYPLGDYLNNRTFKFIAWEDKEPTSIETLKEIANESF